jgi:uncharacterized membrane protein YbhN (UPF0104 family)
VLSGLVVFASYALLIDVWRRLVGASASVPFWRAAHVFFVSSLGKYVPGKVWALGAMAVLARREGVPAAVGASAAILNQLVNLAAGFVVVAVTGARALPVMWPAAAWAVPVFAALGALALVALPVALPRLTATVARRLGRQDAAVVTPGALWYAVASNAIAWFLYGAAFHLFVLALGVGGGGDWLTSVAVFTGSYVLGYLFLLAPGGIGVREVVMGAALTGLHLATPAQAAVVAFGSRLWLTVLEIAPGALFIAHDAATRSTRSRPHDVPTRRPGPGDRT